MGAIFRYKAADVLEEKTLTKIIDKFRDGESKRFKRLDDYYRVRNKILHNTVTDGKPNNKLAHGFAKYITKMATGYFMGRGIRYIVEDGESEADTEEYKKLLFEVLDNNYTTSGNFEIAKESSKKGIAFEILYIDEKGRLKTKKLDADDVIPIYSPDLGEFLECAIRLWHTTSTVNSEKIIEYAAVYTESEIYSYSRIQGGSRFELYDIQNHMMDDIPIILYWNNEEQTGDFEDVITLIDAYDKAQSDTANDSDYFADAYFYITGALGGVAGGDDDENKTQAYRTMRRERILELDENGQAGWITKNNNDTSQENYKTRLYKDIFFISQVPPLSDESFAGNLAGVAIRYKLIGLEELTMEKEHKFISAQKKKIRLITGFINTKYNKNFNADTVSFKMERNLIDNTAEAITNAKMLEGMTSRETQLGMLPFIEDAAAEMEKIKDEQMEDIMQGDIYQDNDFSLNNLQEGHTHEEV